MNGLLQGLHALAYTVLALVLLTELGNVLCRRMLIRMRRPGVPDSSADGAFSAGRLIGWLERLVLAAGLLSNSWEILAAVIALKTVARFKELDQRDFAEYFLVGSLFSILWAIVVTGAWMLYDQHWGVGMRATLMDWLSASSLPPLIETAKVGG